MGIKYQPGLDGLRALAAIAVVGLHTGFPGFDGGGRGVDVFFVLSGFLITSILADQVRDGRVDAPRFWLRRARRLMPALLLLLVIYVAFAPIYWPEAAANRWRDVLFAGLYLTDYTVLAHTGPSPLGHTWSLAIEEQFYFLWPLLFPLVIRLRSPVQGLVALWLTMTLGRFLVYAATQDAAAAYFPFHTHATGLVLGAALALSPPLPRMGWIGAAALVVLCMTDPTPWGEVGWRITAAELAAALLISDLVRPSVLARALSWDPLRRLGLVSYGVYLWHLPVCLALLFLRPVYRGPVVLGLSIALATISYLTVERWVRQPRFAVLLSSPAS